MHLEVSIGYFEFSECITNTRTELRNTFYHHFIDLSPSTNDAANLACVNQQVHAEFTTLYLSRLYQGTTGVPFEHIPFFLHFFFVQYPDAAPKNVRYKFNVGLGNPGPKSIDGDLASCWSLDLLKVVSVMRKYPLIEVVWDLGAGMGRYSAVSFDDTDIAYAVIELRYKASTYILLIFFSLLYNSNTIIVTFIILIYITIKKINSNIIIFKLVLIK